MVYWKFPAQEATKAVSSPSIYPGTIVRDMAWQPGQGGLLALSTNRGGRIVSMGQEETEPVEFGTHMTEMSSLAWSPAGELLATIGEEYVIWNLNGIRVATLETLPGTLVTSRFDQAPKPHFNDSGRLVLVTRVYGALMFRSYFDVNDTHTGVLLQSIDSGFSIYRFIPSFEKIAWKNELEFFSRGAGETINLWRIGLDVPIQVMASHNASTMAFNPNRGILATGGNEGSLRLWDPAMSVLTGGNTEVLGVTWLDLDSGLLATYNTDGQVRIWDALSKTLLHVHEIFEWAQVKYQIKFSPDGRFFAVAVCDKNVKVVRVNTGETVAVCEEIGQDVDWSPKGNKLAVRTTREDIDMVWVPGEMNLPTITVHNRDNVSVYNLDKITGINLRDLSMMRVAVLMEKNLSNGQEEAKDVLSKEGLPQALITEICSHLMEAKDNLEDTSENYEKLDLSDKEDHEDWW